MKEKFNIPAINNQLEALAIHLGIDSDIEQELSTIEQVSISWNIHTYIHDNQTYDVSHSNYLPHWTYVQFNWNIWSVVTKSK